MKLAGFTLRCLESFVYSPVTVVVDAIADFCAWIALNGATLRLFFVARADVDTCRGTSSDTDTATRSFVGVAFVDLTITIVIFVVTFFNRAGVGDPTCAIATALPCRTGVSTRPTMLCVCTKVSTCLVTKLLSYRAIEFLAGASLAAVSCRTNIPALTTVEVVRVWIDTLIATSQGLVGWTFDEALATNA